MSRSEEQMLKWLWAMPFGDYFIWGATAGMLRSLYRHLRLD